MIKLSTAQERVLKLMKEGYTYRIAYSSTGDVLHYLMRGSEVEPLRKDTAAKLIELDLIATCNADHDLVKYYYITEKGKVL